MIEWKPNEPETFDGKPATLFVPMNDEIPFQDLLDVAVEIKARMDALAEGRPDGK